MVDEGAAVRLPVAARHVVWVMPMRLDSPRAAITPVAEALGDRRIDTRAAVDDGFIFRVGGTGPSPCLRA